jgi:hypothetical protein
MRRCVGIFECSWTPELVEKCLASSVVAWQGEERVERSVLVWGALPLVTGNGPLKCLADSSRDRRQEVVRDGVLEVFLARCPNFLSWGDGEEDPMLARRGLDADRDLVIRDSRSVLRIVLHLSSGVLVGFI